MQNSSAWELIGPAINRRPLGRSWEARAFDFQQLESKAPDLSDICTVYIPGALAFRSDLKDKLFPNPTNLEFLPITASGQSWMLLNCLQSASDIDLDESEVMRTLDGEICLVMKALVTDPRARNWDVFTLEASNRAQLLVSDDFRRRVKALKLEGITFRVVGQVA